MELAKQIVFIHKAVKSDTVQDLKEFNSQSSATQAKKGEQLVSMMPAFEKLSTEWVMIYLTYLQKMKL